MRGTKKTKKAKKEQELNPSEQSFLRLLYLMAAPRRTFWLNTNIYQERDANGNIYEELALRLHDKGYIKYDRKDKKAILPDHCKSD